MTASLDRRRFFLLGAGTAIVSNLRGATLPALPRSVVVANDETVERYLQAQAINADHPFHGGIADPRELYLAGDAGRFLQTAVAAYCCETSRYFRDQNLAERIGYAISFLESQQSEDGNVDLLTTNFNSPPDTGFVVHKVARAANIARLYGADAIAEKFQQFLLTAGHGLSKGGIHTPNHRWVVCAALAQINELYPKESYVNRIDTWLAEGIDIDREGQFTERSTGGYNAICDEAFVVLAEKLQRPELLDPVRKNLDAMAYLLHPSGEVVTEFSNRQDRNTRATMDAYWFPLRYLAITDDNGLYASMLDRHEPKAMGLPWLMEYPKLTDPLPSRKPIPNDYDLELPGSGVTRIRRGRTSATFIHQRNSRWISIHHGDAVINAIRFASAFFGKGQFVPTKFQRNGDELCFFQSLEGRYYQPLTDPTELPVTQKQYGVKRRRREVSEVCTLTYEGRIRETDQGFAISIRAIGTAGIPLAIEFNLRSAIGLVGTEPLGDNRFLLKQGMAEYKVDNDTIRFGPGIAQHRYTQIRGAQDKLSGPSVYLTAYTPFETTLQIHVS